MTTRRKAAARAQGRPLAAIRRTKAATAAPAKTRPTRRGDAVLLNLCRQWQANSAAINAAMRRKSTAAIDVAIGRRVRAGWRLFDRLTAIEPTTLAGLAAQAAIVVIELRSAHSDRAGHVEICDPDTRGAFRVLGYIAKLAKGGTP